MKKLLLFALLFGWLISQSRADGGDTLVIQTIDFNTPPLPGWNSPRDGKYLFPPDTVQFSKILMYYTLKCDPTQNPACGEWDYTTRTRILEHTGVMDSNLYYHPNFVVNNSSPDTFMLMHDTSYFFKASLQYSNWSPVTDTATPGTAGLTFSLPFDTESPDGRAQFLYPAEELQQAGLQAGNITALELTNTGGEFSSKHFTLRLAGVSLDSLPQDIFVEEGLETVFRQDIHWSGPGKVRLDFAFPFWWDGTSDLLIDFSYSDHRGAAVLEAGTTDSRLVRASTERDFFLDFEGWDYFRVPAQAFETVDSAITIVFWQFGNPAVQPINCSAFEGMDSAGNRVLNAHLPWSNERIYWDAGWDDGYDRIDRGSGEASAYKGQWNHWVFTKDVRSGQMRVYLNGVLWNIGSSKRRPMNGITDFRVGSGINRYYYAGMIDEFQIWDTVLDWDVIKQWMNRKVTADHPYYNHLRAYYRLDEGQGEHMADNSPNHFDAEKVFGYPRWDNYGGSGRFTRSESLAFRPHLSLFNGTYNPETLDSLVVVDTFARAPLNIVFYGADEPLVPLDTLKAWPAYYAGYVYDEGGNAIDSSLVEPDSIIYRVDLPYYGDPYEVINRWEIGRFITPYGIGLDLGQGWTWVYDVTDYEPLLHDSVHITAGNFQELLDLKFYMIKGTPPRDVLKIEKVYSGYYGLKNFPTLVPPKKIGLLPEASTFKLKTRTSGHLFSNPTNCAEFCPKVHSVLVNGQEAKSWQILRECADNVLYPQGGTWIYDRAGWCPGMKVDEQDIEITQYITGDSVLIDYNSEPDEYGAYSLEVQLFSYGNPNFRLDAAVDEVLAPNKLKRYGRGNPTASSPIVVIQNRGGDTLTSLNITYGPAGSSQTYHWQGTLPFMQKERVELPTFPLEDWEGGNGVFLVNVSQPNGQADENPVNDTYRTNYELPVVYPATFVIHFKTNNRAYQNRYEILSAEGYGLVEKSEFENNTLYVDTVSLPNGCYDFYLWDSGDNGISFWANNEGAGYLKFYDLDGELIQSFTGDFGKFLHKSFCNMYVGTDEFSGNELSVKVVPNPGDGHITVNYVSDAKRQGTEMEVAVFNSSGQQLRREIVRMEPQGKLTFDLSSEPAGIYTCVLLAGNRSISRKFIISR